MAMIARTEWLKTRAEEYRGEEVIANRGAHREQPQPYRRWNSRMNATNASTPATGMAL
jgi:hypothetical protein